jgi:hypothetical protein
MENTVGDDSGTVDDDGGEGWTTAVAEGVIEAAEDVVEGGATVEPFMLATFLLCVVAAAKVSFVVEAAASLRAYLASLDIFLQSKHVRRGFMVPFLIFSRK